MSPATMTAPAVTARVPLAPTSPVMFSVPLPLTVTASPPAPPQPAPLRAATVGLDRRLLTLPGDAAALVWLVRLVSPRPKGSDGARVAVRSNRLPGGPSLRATLMSLVPSE